MNLPTYYDHQLRKLVVSTTELWIVSQPRKDIGVYTWLQSAIGVLKNPTGQYITYQTNTRVYYQNLYYEGFLTLEAALVVMKAEYKKGRTQRKESLINILQQRTSVLKPDPDKFQHTTSKVYGFKTALPELHFTEIGGCISAYEYWSCLGFHMNFNSWFDKTLNKLVKDGEAFVRKNYLSNRTKGKPDYFLGLQLAQLIAVKIQNPHKRDFLVQYFDTLETAAILG